MIVLVLFNCLVGYSKCPQSLLGETVDLKDLIFSSNKLIRHINPLMFDVIDDEPEGVARWVYHV